MAAIGPEELLRRIQVLEKSQAAKSTFVAAKSGERTVRLHSDDPAVEDIHSIGFVKMTVEGKVVYVPAFGKVE